jgi:hypothetical protein
MSIIIPDGIDQKEIRVPMQFPLRADADSVVDASDRIVFTMDNSVEIGESLKFTKLFSKAPEMFQLLGSCYATLAAIALNTEGLEHGTPNENKEECLLCRCEEILKSLE